MSEMNRLVAKVLDVIGDTARATGNQYEKGDVRDAFRYFGATLHRVAIEMRQLDTETVA